MRIVSAIFRIIIAAIFGGLCFLLLTPALAAFISPGSGLAPSLVLVGFVLVGGVVGLISPSIRRAFGWSFLALALCVVALPLSTMLLAGRVAVEATNAATANDQGATVLGAGIAGTLLSGGAAIIGFFLGAIFLVIALILLLGGRRQVILVDRATGREVAAESYDEPQLTRGRAASRIEPPPLR